MAAEKILLPLDADDQSAGTYRVSWRDPAGKQRARTLRTKRETKAFLAQVEADASRGSYVDPHAGRRVLLRDFAEDWVAGRTVEATTDERTRSILRTHVLPQWGAWPLGHQQISTTLNRYTTMPGTTPDLARRSRRSGVLRAGC